jgi:hypothetical protein
MFLRSIAAGALVLALASQAAPVRGSAATEQLPNLVALAPFDLQIAPADAGEGALAIRFATGAANRGEHALELSGQPSGPSEAIAHQCVAWLQPRVCAETQEVGTFGWHPDHGHFHFEDFARYDLRKLRRNGRPDLRKRGLVATSGKISYCIIDYEPDASDRSLLYSQPYPLYYSCAAGIGVQGISPGWKDIYVEQTTGQQIPVEGIPDGTYALIVKFDPANRLFETDETDNVALAKIELSGGGSALQVLCSQEPGQEDCLPVADPE